MGGRVGGRVKADCHQIIYVAKATEISREMERLHFGRDEILARPLKFKSLYNMIIPPPADPTKTRTPRSKRKLNRNLAKEKPLDVLVVDDSPVNVAVCRRILELYGYTGVDAASDGMQAVEMAEKRRYDLILLDLQMPSESELDVELEAIVQDADTTQFWMGSERSNGSATRRSRASRASPHSAQMSTRRRRTAVLRLAFLPSCASRSTFPASATSWRRCGSCARSRACSLSDDT